MNALMIVALVLAAAPAAAQDLGALARAVGKPSSEQVVYTDADVKPATHVTPAPPTKATGPAPTRRTPVEAGRAAWTGRVRKACDAWQRDLASTYATVLLKNCIAVTNQALAAGYHIVIDAPTERR